MVFINDDKTKNRIFLKNDPYLAHVIPDNGTVQSVSDHLFGTMELAEQNCPLKILKNIVICEALLHDAGKLNDDFFKYMKDILEKGGEARKRLVDHTSAGGRILEELIGRNMLFEFIGTAVYSHHGLQDNVDMDSGDTLFEKRREKEIQFATIQQRYFEIIDRTLLLKYLFAAHTDLQTILKQIEDFVKRTGKRNCGDRAFYLGNV